MKKKIAVKALGYDLSTTALSLAGRANDGEEVFVSIPMRGATTWQGQPAFDLNELSWLFLAALAGIGAQDFELAPNGVISGSVRQHDLVLLGNHGLLLMPALSWQCNAATKEVERLKAEGAEAMVGRLEPRLILPKLLWALGQDLALRVKIKTVMTTGDFVAQQLTGAQTLSSSEGLSNGLLVQNTRRFAQKLIDSVLGLESFWFPPLVRSGEVIRSQAKAANLSGDWEKVRALLPGWRVVAGLGDNHAGAVGSGLVDRQTIVISAGTSGTVTRAVKLGTALTGTALQFEYYDDTLLLLMMADCASWYNRFVKQFAGDTSYEVLNDLAQAAGGVYYLEPPTTQETPFPDSFSELTLGQQARSLQFSIAICLISHFKRMWEEVAAEDADQAIKRVVLTGGLTASSYFCEVLKQDLRYNGFKGSIYVSSRVGPLANQAATLGALINALVGGGLYPSLAAAIKELCPAREI